MLTKVPKCNRIAECIADKRCVWNGDPGTKDLRCMFFENKLKAVQEKKMKSDHLPEVRRLNSIDTRIARLESDRTKRINTIVSLLNKARIKFDVRINRLREQKEKLIRTIYGKEKEV